MAEEDETGPQRDQDPVSGIRQHHSEENHIEEGHDFRRIKSAVRRQSVGSQNGFDGPGNPGIFENRGLQLVLVPLFPLHKSSVLLT